ncbi:MAG: aminodeoxychorismate/anthranilate synthase component II [Ruminococcus sp.]|nr:aminodeoxychorismate/anthranilate synthase component II [Ruminococcus sp.]
MILLIDNFDSFSFNLYQLAGSIEPNIKTIRNNDADADDIRKMNPSHIIISPGPGRPCDAGNCISIIRGLAGEIPILGVCLGHQSIVEAFGGKVVHAGKLVHGKAETIEINNEHPLFRGLGKTIRAARYHSLAADKDTLPDCLEVLGMSSDNEIMSVAHKELPVYGVQFHPESIMTPQGDVIMRNFLNF